MGLTIEAISYYLPEKVLTNEELASEFNINPADIYKKTGVKKRHLVDLDVIVSDFTVKSAEKLFKENNINRNDIDAIIFCSSAIDYKVPATACVIQEKLNLGKNIYTLDLRHGCTGFVYSLSLGKGLIKSGQANNILLFTVDIPTIILHPEDLELRMIFGDAAVVSYITNQEQSASEVGEFVFGTDGAGVKNLYVKRSGSVDRIDVQWLKDNEAHGGLPYGRMVMNSVEIFTFTLREVPPLIEQILKKNKLTMTDIDLFIFHQANAFLLNTLRRKLKIPEDKFYICLENVGNTISGTIPIALKEAINEGRAKKGDKILLAAFGIGYSWCGTVITL